VTPEEHRRLGIDLYNSTWELIERDDRTSDDDDEMLHRAHASAYHWLQGPHTTANRARSHWLCSRVHALAGQPEGALHHGRRCLELVEGHGEEMEDWDLAGAHEALARAHLAAGETEQARRHYETARAETAKIANPHDRKHIDADLDALPL
jgi:hypothetical protein